MAQDNEQQPAGFDPESTAQFEQRLARPGRRRPWLETSDWEPSLLSRMLRAEPRLRRTPRRP